MKMLSKAFEAQITSDMLSWTGGLSGELWMFHTLPILLVWSTHSEKQQVWSALKTSFCWSSKLHNVSQLPTLFSRCSFSRCDELVTSCHIYLYSSSPTSSICICTHNRVFWKWRFFFFLFSSPVHVVTPRPTTLVWLWPLALNTR